MRAGWLAITTATASAGWLRAAAWTSPRPQSWMPGEMVMGAPAAALAGGMPGQRQRGKRPPGACPRDRGRAGISLLAGPEPPGPR